MPVVKGWLFDVYSSGDGMVIWLITVENQRLRLEDNFAPTFYIEGPSTRVMPLLSSLISKGMTLSFRLTEKQELFSGEWWPVWEVKVYPATKLPRVLKQITEKESDLQVFNVDLPLSWRYFHEKKVFPLAFCQVEYHPREQILNWEVLDSPRDTDYQFPPLTSIELKMEGKDVNPNHGKRGALEVRLEGKEHLLEVEGKELISYLNVLLRRYDPDIIFTHWGDSFLLPHLMEIAGRGQIPLALNRENNLRLFHRREHSYFSYGQVIYRAGAWMLRGRWHLDWENSFILAQAGWEGLLELARLTRIPVQQLARTSTGTGITSMQLATALEEGILIPWRKKQPEDFKSARDLILVDKGGLVYRPVPGFYEGVAEIDFSSMFPTLMAQFNLSPETVKCRCCAPGNSSGHRVPEIGYWVCRRRRGLVPKTLELLLEKRSCYKQLMSKSSDPEQKKIYQARQVALKWMLVTCFGYLGYKNARFGRIEAHEAVTAYSREKLLQAKEIVEARGFRMLHALVDSLWVQKEGVSEQGVSEQEYQELVRILSQETGLPLALEGIYRWIVFLPSRSFSRLAVPNRYFGVFFNGEIKVRGLEVRRSDVPPIVKKAQQEMLEYLFAANNFQEYRERISGARQILEQYLEYLKEGRADFAELVITRTLSHQPQDYQKNSLLAIVSRELSGRGIKLHPGESLALIITDSRAREKSDRAQAYVNIDGDRAYDQEKYCELLLRAWEPLYFPLKGNSS